MHKTETEARDVFLIGAFFMGYALLLWLVARRESLGRVLDASAGYLDGNRLEFARRERGRMIAEEHDDAV